MDDEDNQINNIGHSKKDNVSNNSNKFKAGITEMQSETPGINKRIVRLKDNNDSNAVVASSLYEQQEDENPDDWMRDLTADQVAVIMDGELCLPLVLNASIIYRLIGKWIDVDVSLIHEFMD